ncbi:MAG: PP2C family protein-serine/threonine phosphatase [Candidatus Krumholzibacteriia bacterium]
MTDPEAARILVVDDEPGIQRTARRILGRHHRVTLASSGAEALEVLAREPHDLAIVDVRMPGMTGFEALKSIKAQFPDTEVIIMTGSISNPEEKLVEALRERAFYFINKPFEKAVLETLVQRCLERQRLERENRAYTLALEMDLDRARAFQRLLLPSSFPRVVGLRGDVMYEPSERLGGDYYDFFALGSTKLGVLIADVAGHGVTAALYTGMLKSEMRAVQEEWCEPDRLFQRINDRLTPVTRNQYVTAILAILDVETQELRYVSAGHPSFFTGDGRAWESTGTPLGMLPGYSYDVGVLPLRPGERLLFYTDGLTEALRDDGTDFGTEQLRAVFATTRGMPPDEAVAKIIGAVKSFTGKRTLHDDATAILLEYDPA